MSAGRFSKTLCAGVVAASLVGCDTWERYLSERTVCRYNAAVAEAYRLSTAAGLAEVATAGEMNRVQVLIDLKRSNHLVLESRLEACRVEHVRRTEPETLVVESRERWRYFDRPLQLGAAPGPELVADMRLEWQLVRRDGAWKVDRGKTLENTFVGAGPVAVQAAEVEGAARD